MDRLIEFYERIFDARVTLDRTDEGRRHAFIEIGPHTMLHPFEVPTVEVPDRQPIFERGRLDHFALNAASEEAFREIRRRLIAEEANATEGGLVTDMGSMLSFSFHDPDGGWHEVMWVKPASRRLGQCGARKNRQVSPVGTCPACSSGESMTPSSVMYVETISRPITPPRFGCQLDDGGGRGSPSTNG